MSGLSVLVANIEEQKEEVESLLSIYGESKQKRDASDTAPEDATSISIDPEALSAVSEWLLTQQQQPRVYPAEGSSTACEEDSDNDDHGYPPDEISMTVRLEHGQHELSFVLPPEYPADARPTMYVRSKSLSRTHEAELIRQLEDIALEIQGACSVFQLIEAAKDILQEDGFQQASAHGVEGDAVAPSSSSPFPSESEETQQCEFVRQFIYFHHIRNKQKKHNIVNFARELDLTGFSVVGKPGLVCVEGLSENITDYVGRVRRLHWQRMQIKMTQRFPIEKDALVQYKTIHEALLPLRKFDGMHQLAIGGGYHPDLGEVRSYLDTHGLGDTFEELYAI